MGTLQHFFVMKLGRYAGLALLIVAAQIGSATAQDGKTYSYHTSARESAGTAPANKQTAEEMEDIGEISETESTFRDKLRVNVNARAAYTTNARLDGNHSSGDLLLLPAIEVGFHTPLGKHFSFDLSTKVESATYTTHDELGFAAYSAQATLDYRIKQGLPRFYVTLEPYRYDSYDTGDLLTQAIGYTGGTDWGFAFNGGRTLGFVGASFTDYVSDPSIDSRLAYRGIVGVAHQIRSNLTAQLYYQYQYSDFTDFDRQDSKHTVAANLIYQINEHWFGSMTTSLIDNDSDRERASYQTFSTTLGITLNF